MFSLRAEVETALEARNAAERTAQAAERGNEYVASSDASRARQQRRRRYRAAGVSSLPR